MLIFDSRGGATEFMLDDHFNNQHEIHEDAQSTSGSICLAANSETQRAQRRGGRRGRVESAYPVLPSAIVTPPENEISGTIIGAAIEVHRQLGPGLLESVYEEALCYELNQARLSFQRQQRVPIRYKGILLSSQLRLDLLVEDRVIVETKAKTEVTPIDQQQLLTYLRLRDLRLGLIINFHTMKLVDGVHRVVNQLGTETA